MIETPLRIALLGTRGAPARYGGFETAVEEIGARLAAVGHHVTAYCRNPGQTITSYRGINLVNLPTVPVSGAETLAHTALSILHNQLRPADVAVVFNAANAPLVPMLHARGIPTIVNVDGVEWKRAKWGPTAKRYYRWAERVAVRQADALIADAKGIQDYYVENHKVCPEFIPYGAPLRRNLGADLLGPLDLTPGGYHLVVARYEPENNLPLIIDGFQRSDSRLPLVIVGHAPFIRPEIAAALARAEADPRIRLIGPVWDQDQLDQLYANSASYLHGHSVGGTNPSLLRAMGAAAPTIAFDVNFNREVLGWTGVYFGGPDQLARAIETAELLPERARAQGLAGQERVGMLYDWDDVAFRYEELCTRLVTRVPAGSPARSRIPTPFRPVVDLTVVPAPIRVDLTGIDLTGVDLPGPSVAAPDVEPIVA